MNPQVALVLVGPPGAPVAEVAAVLADRWGAPLADTDVLVAGRTGRTPADLLVQDGEEALREVERAVALPALAAGTGVVALSSGAVEDEQVRAALAAWSAGGGHVVLLDLAPTTAARRAGLHAGSTALVGTRARWRALFDARHPRYLEVATLVVAVDELDVAGAADAVDAGLVGPQD